MVLLMFVKTHTHALVDVCVCGVLTRDTSTAGDHDKHCCQHTIPSGVVTVLWRWRHQSGFAEHTSGVTSDLEPVCAILADFMVQKLINRSTCRNVVRDAIMTAVAVV